MIYTLLGITEDELHTVFKEQIKEMAAEYELTEEEMKAKLKRQFNGSADAAIQQIQDKGYAREYESSPKHIHLIGCNFSSKTGTIDGWEVRWMHFNSYIDIFIFITDTWHYPFCISSYIYDSRNLFGLLAY